MDEYIQLGLHHYPDIRVDFLYITRDRVPQAPTGLPERTHYRTTTWEHVAQAISTAWDDAHGDDGLHAARFVNWIRTDLMTGKPWKRDELMATPPVEDTRSQADEMAGALGIAELVQEDHRQRALPYEFATRSDAEDFRSALREELGRMVTTGDEHISNVRPWVWTVSSTGTPLAPAGLASGVEVRLSYYKAPIA